MTSPPRRSAADASSPTALFIDLDGTLVDSRAGLYPAFHAGARAIGVSDLTDSQLTTFLGTPLPDAFRSLKPSVTAAEIETGIAAFRETYEDVGIPGNVLYPGTIELLHAVRDRGRGAWIVTSKPEHYAVRVVQHLNIEGYVAGVIGAGLAETDTKTGLVARALAAARVANDAVAMVGDRHYDITGALENGVRPIGALWGYGSYKELREAGCREFAHSPDDLRARCVEGLV
jgi:phosphoglycolate phosphatase